jgi:hypothetical protein
MSGLFGLNGIKIPYFLENQCFEGFLMSYFVGLCNPEGVKASVVIGPDLRDRGRTISLDL